MAVLENGGMAGALLQGPDSSLTALRRRGQFLIALLFWAAAGGFVVVSTSYLLIVSHYAISFAERVRTGFGFAAPTAGPDLFLLAISLAGPGLVFFALVVASRWYRRLWMRKVAGVWSNRRHRRMYSRYRSLAARAEHPQYLQALLASPGWRDRAAPSGVATDASRAEWLLEELEKDIAERALATGLTVGASQNSAIDLLTIFAAALELQLHVLSQLGKRPSIRAWQLLVQRCGASLFLNSYLNRQDSLALNLMIKKAGMGLQVGGDLLENAAHHLTDSDFDLDEALPAQHGGLLGLATKGLEIGATMSLTVGQVGLHVLGTLIESVGDELTQGTLAAGILYHHGMALAADTLALDAAHRASPAMNRNFREGVWKMGEIAGGILRDLVRQRRTAFRDRRSQVIRSLPKSAYARVQALFGRKTAAPPLS